MCCTLISVPPFKDSFTTPFFSYKLLGFHFGFRNRTFQNFIIFKFSSQIFRIGEIVTLAKGNYTALAIKGGVIGIRWAIFKKVYTDLYLLFVQMLTLGLYFLQCLTTLSLCQFANPNVPSSEKSKRLVVQTPSNLFKVLDKFSSLNPSVGKIISSNTKGFVHMAILPLVCIDDTYFDYAR